MAADKRAARLGGEAVVTDEERLDSYEADTYWKAIASRANGSPRGRPDLVVLAKSDEDVTTVLHLANQFGVPVVPWGGGSGSQGGAILTRGGIALDLKGLDRIVEVDEESLTVTAEAGVNGQRLEAELNERGLMLPHYPASADLATVGGYVAARGSGVLSTRYGKIEDLVVALRVVTPAGEVIDTLPVPRHAVGPELTQLFIGSEGTLGVITRATLGLRPLPAARRFEAVSFPSVPDGIAAIRDAIARGYRPSVVRLYDETATRLTLSPVVGEELDGACTILCFEGEHAVVGAEAEGVPRSEAPGFSTAALAKPGGGDATSFTARRTTRSCRPCGERSKPSPHTRGSTASTRRFVRQSSPTSTTASRSGSTSATGTRGGR